MERRKRVKIFNTLVYTERGINEFIDSITENGATNISILQTQSRKVMDDYGSDYVCTDTTVVYDYPVDVFNP